MHYRLRHGRNKRAGRAYKALNRATRALVEHLETREMLSISDAAFVDPRFVIGNTWTYQVAVTNGPTGVTTQTVVGPANFNGSSAIEIDTTAFGKVISQDYFGQSSDGSYVTFGFNGSGNSSTGATYTRQTTIYSPYRQGFPPDISAATPYTHDNQASITIYDSSGNVTATSTSSESATFTLTSATPTPRTYNGHTYQTYQTTEVRTITPVPDDGTPPTTTTDTQYWAPNIGLVEDDSAGATYKLLSFNGQADQLVFGTQPTNIAAPGNPIQPAVTVEAHDSTGIDKNATGTVTLSLQSASRLNTSTGTLTGNPSASFVDGVATFPGLSVTANGTYQLVASDDNNDPSSPSSKFKVGTTALQLTINSYGYKKTGAVTGDNLFYTITLSRQKSIQTLQLVDTLPTGFVPMKAVGGSISGSTITWTNPNLRSVTFEARVPDGATLSKGIGASANIVDSATCQVTYTDSTDDVANATNTVKVETDFTVSGTLNNIRFNFPSIQRVLASVPLGGITAQLIDSSGNVAASVVTAGNGSFKLKPDKGGDYTLQFSAVAQTYSSGPNYTNPVTVYVGQVISIPLSNTKATPIKLGDVVMPLALFDQASKILNSLNNLATSSQFQGLASFNLNLFQFDTTAAEGVINGLVGAPGSPTPFMNAAALKNSMPDPWVAAIRMMAGLEEVYLRFLDSWKLADSASKALSVVIGASVAKAVGPWAGGLAKTGTKIPYLSPTFSKLTSMVANVSKVGSLSAIGAWLPLILDDSSLGKYKLSAETKNYLFLVICNFIRYASDLFTGKLIGDLGFETVFNIARLTFDSAILTVTTGVTLRSDLAFPYNLIGTGANYLGSLQTSVVTLQDVINQAVTNRAAYVSDTDTMLDALGRYEDFLHTEALKGLRNFGLLNGLSSFLRGTTGILEIQSQFSTFNPNTPLPQAQAQLQQGLTTVNNSLASGFGQSASKLGTQALLAAMVSTLLSFGEQSFYTPDINDILISGQFSSIFASSVKSRSNPNPPAPAAPVVPAAPVATPAESLATAAAATAALSDSAAFIADLTQLSTLVKTGDTNGIGALFSGNFGTHQQALFNDDLVLLDQLVSADLASLSAAQRARTNAFDAALNSAINTTIFAILQVQAWGESPSTGDAKAVTRQINAAIAAVKSAAGLAPGARAAIAAFPVSVALEINENNAPLNASSGSTVTLSFTVTNIGTQPSSAGTITLYNDDGALALQAPTQQTLAPLAPGASATFTWPAQVNTPTNPYDGVVYQVQVLAGTVQGRDTNEIATI